MMSLGPGRLRGPFSARNQDGIDGRESLRTSPPPAPPPPRMAGIYQSFNASVRSKITGTLRNW